MSAPDVDASGRWKTAVGPLDEAYRVVGSRPEGLSDQEAAQRLLEYGPNVLPSARRLGLGRKFLRQLRNLFNVLLLFAAVLSFVVGLAFNDVGALQFGYAVVAIVLFNTAFSLTQEFRAERTVEALRRLIPANARALRMGRLSELPVSQIVPGDVIALEQGDRIPADARLTTAFSLAVDHSALTGESEPVPRTAEDQTIGADRDVTEYPNLVFAGTTIVSGSGTALVLTTGNRTRFGQIVARTQEVRVDVSPLQREVDKFARTNFKIAVGVGTSFLAVALVARGLHPLPALLFMIGVMLSLVPEGLQLTVTASLALSSVSMAKANVVTKSLAFVEALGSATVICTDKTGTVTTGQMTVRRAWIAGETYDVSGGGFDPEGAVTRDARVITAGDSAALLRACEIAVLNNQAALVPPLDPSGRRWTAVGDTTEAALLAFAIKAALDPKKVIRANPRTGLLPFDSNRKMMTSLNRASGSIVAFTKGAAREVLAKCASHLTPRGEEALRSQDRADIEVRVDRFARDAFRVLALAYRPIADEPPTYTPETVERDLVFVGLVAIQDSPRTEVPDAVRIARAAGVRVFMLTGDHELTAEAIAKQVGLLTYESQPVVSGAKLAGMSDKELASVVDSPEAVFARIAPEQKHRIVKALKERGEIVAVTGDGVNDAPALAEADIGIAMGITGTDVAREAADMVLTDDNFASIVKGIEVGRGVFDNLRKFSTYVFTHNWGQLVSFVAFVLFSIPLGITVLYILAIDLVMEIPISLALTLEPPGPHVMSRPPRPYGTRLYPPPAILVSMYLGVIVGALGLLAATSVWSQAGWSFGMDSVPDPATYVRGSTLVVAAIMLGQVGNFLARRADPGSAFALSPLRNRWFFPGVLGTLGLLVLVVYAPPFQALFGTGPLAASDWILVLPFAALTLGLEEIRLAVARRITPLPAPPAPATARREGATGGGLPRLATQAREEPPSWARGHIVLPLFLRPADRAAIVVALGIAAAARMGVVVVPLHRGGDPRRLAEREHAIHAMAEQADIDVKYVHFSRAEMPARPSDIARSIAKVAMDPDAGPIVLTAEREPLARSPMGRIAERLPELTEAPIIFVSGPRRAARGWPKLERILIPVLEEFHPEPFEVADLITSGQNVPDVGVVVARVIRIPPIVPLYPTYTPESLVDVEKEMSFLRRLQGRGPRVGESRVLLVRDISEALRDFVKERGVDALILWGDRRRVARIVSPGEVGLVRDPPCPVLVILPARGSGAD